MSVQIERAATEPIDPATQVGLLSLTVADLARSLAFYTDAIGFEVLNQDAESATLGAGGRSLLHLTERSGARPWPRDRQSYTGLYHFAILLPTRTDLGRWLRNWLDRGFPIPGQGDHNVSEALYLEDPDGNGIEVYRDRPRDQWQWVNGQVHMTADPVDIRGLLEDAKRSGQPWTGLPAGTRIGHIHLQVGDIPEASAFYHDVLGFDIMATLPSALFISAGGYHHHIGMNTWHSRGQGSAPEGTAGLRFFTIELPSEEAQRVLLDRIQVAGLSVDQSEGVVTVRDPWDNVIVLQVTSAPEGGSTMETEPIPGD